MNIRSLTGVQSGLTFKNSDNGDQIVPDREAEIVAGSPDLFQMVQFGQRPILIKAMIPTREG